MKKDTMVIGGIKKEVEVYTMSSIKVSISSNESGKYFARHFNSGTWIASNEDKALLINSVRKALKNVLNQEIRKFKKERVMA